MNLNGKYALLVVAGLALVALWYVHTNRLVSEGFSAQARQQSGNLMENFNTAQKEEACKALTEQLKTYTDMLNKPASTEEEKQRSAEISKALEMTKAQAAKFNCS